MSDRRTAFRDGITRVKNDYRKASDDLVRRLKKLTPEEFLRQSPRIFDGLTLDQYRDVVATIAPQVDLPAAGANEADAAKKRLGGLTTWWRNQSAWTKSTIATIIVTAIFSVVGVITPHAFKWTLSRLEVVRPAVVTTWPVCKRLSRYTDGCVYYPVQDLNWDWVAWKLNLPVEVLRRNNPDLQQQWIPARAQLVIWRERGRLEN